MADSFPVSVTPKEGLFFPPPLDRSIQNIITVKNESDKPVTFKIKTTAPTNYHVKPRMCILDARASSNVKITLRPLAGLGDALPQHKFQIEARSLTEEEVEKMRTTSADSLWTAPVPGHVTRIRMNCSFTTEVPEGAQVQFLSGPDDSRSEVSAMDIHTEGGGGGSNLDVARFTSAVDGPSTRSPSHTDALQKDIQVLRQSLAATENALQEAKRRVEDLQQECKAAKDVVAKAAGNKVVRLFKRILYLALLGAAGYALVQYGPAVLCPVVQPCGCPTNTHGHCVPIGAAPPAAVESEETGPGLEKWW